MYVLTKTNKIISLYIYILMDIKIKVGQFIKDKVTYFHDCICP